VTQLSRLNAVIAVPATRTVRCLPTEVRLDAEDAMPGERVLSFDNGTLVPKAFVRERICTLRPQRMESVGTALALATGCR
jgi:mRNA-degrading endonuclease toxin of MazEF toxin-antitoxin module